jgi:23S rRNA (adenine2030-N6)-methyltransferase
MLSYQHAYHAGNLADVHKHSLLAWVLEYLVQKDKPLSYIETHAGRGLYDLAAPEALKTGEAQAGIAVLADALPPGHPYRRRLAETRAMYGAAAYPGSPMIAALTLRRGDTLHLAELHPQEHAALLQNLGPRGALIRREDGFAMALALCPPTPRRGLLLADPSYEVKDDYAAIPRALQAIHRKWNVGILMLWYPILQSGAHREMVTALSRSFPAAFRHEISFPPARDGHRMTGSGIFVVNPPFGLADEAARLTAMFQSTFR